MLVCPCDTTAQRSTRGTVGDKHARQERGVGTGEEEKLRRSRARPPRRTTNARPAGGTTVRSSPPFPTYTRVEGRREQVALEASKRLCRRGRLSAQRGAMLRTLPFSPLSLVCGSTAPRAEAARGIVRGRLHAPLVQPRTPAAPRTRGRLSMKASAGPARRMRCRTAPHSPHALQEQPAQRLGMLTLQRQTAGLRHVKAGAQRSTARSAPAILPVQQPSILELALSTELISATASVPLALVAYRPLCGALGALLNGTTVSGDVLSYYVTLVGLLFGFIVSNTYYFLYSQQEEIYESIYAEASAVNRLLEEAECALLPADAQVIAFEVRRFLTDGAWAHQEDSLPAEILALEILADDDAMENLLKYVLAVEPAGGLNMIDTVRLLRDATVVRLAASQRKIPGVQFFVCKVLAALVLVIFPLMRAGATESIVSADIEAILFGALVGTVILFLSLVDDLADTNTGLYSVAPVRATLQTALLAKADSMLDAGGN